MKLKLIILALSFALLLPSGGAFAEFAANTSVEPVSVYGEYPDNIDRSKNSQLEPPPFGAADFNYPADAQSYLTPALAERSAPQNPSDTYTPGQSGGYSIFGEPAGGSQPSAPSDVRVKFTPASAIVGKNNLLGTLTVNATGKTMNVYEGETLSNMQLGAAHFSETGAWDGNVALCGHNRGSWPFFSFVKSVRLGDTFVYKTSLGTRTYEVISKEQISYTDRSVLNSGSENLLTLITCVEDVPERRWCVVAREVV